jgi:hypothetical protein
MACHDSGIKCNRNISAYMDIYKHLFSLKWVCCMKSFYCSGTPTLCVVCLGCIHHFHSNALREVLSASCVSVHKILVYLSFS